MEREEVVPLQASVGVFLRFNCPSPDQEDTIILLQPDIGVNDNKDKKNYLHNKPLLARSLRDQQRSGSIKG